MSTFVNKQICDLGELTGVNSIVKGGITMVHQKTICFNLETGEVISEEVIPLPDEDPAPYLDAQANYYAKVILKQMEEENMQRLK